MAPSDRFVTRFAAEPPQEGLPYGRWADRLRHEFLGACLGVETDDGEDLGTPGDIVWFPPGEKHWHGAGAETAIAAAIGAGLQGTWPTDSTLPPFAAIDHVLVSGPVAPVDLTTRILPGTDHAGVVVRLLVRDARVPVPPGA